MKIFKKITTFFNRKKVIHLTIPEFDKMVDSKLIKIREFYRVNIDCRDDSELFDKQLGETYKVYGNIIKKELTKSITTKKKIIVLSPFRYRKWCWKRINIEFIQIKTSKKVIIKFFNKIIKFYVRLMVLRNIRRIKKLFPNRNISNRRAENIINSVKLNKRILYSKNEKSF